MKPNELFTVSSSSKWICFPIFICICFVLVLFLGQPAKTIGGSDPDRFLIASVDYVQGEVIITFRAAYMPQRSNVTSRPPRIRISPIDSVFQSIGGSELRKMLSWDDVFCFEEGDRLARTFVLQYDAPIDAQEMVENLSRSPYFERVTLNRIHHLRPHGTRQLIPGDTTLFSAQWYFHNSDPGDRSDIDLPEAWAIEPGGEPNLVIGIFDEGTMVDTNTSDLGWKLHSDFNYHWISEEDSHSPGVINGADLDGVDDNEDTPPLPTPHDLYAYAANIIGLGFMIGYDEDTSKNRFWYGVPHSWELQTFNCDPPTPCPNSWEIINMGKHGVWVGSIAAGKLDGLKPSPFPDPPHPDIVGVAYKSKVYNVRYDPDQTSVQMVHAIYHLAKICRVVNMSFGYAGDPEPNIEAAIIAATAPVSMGGFDCVLVASSGNNGSLGLDYPAIYDSVLAVGALKRSPLILWEGSSWEPQARLVDVVAPAVNSTGGAIIVDSFTDCYTSLCSPQETTGPTERLGTSFAAPQVSGLAALIRSRFPTLNQAQVKQRIRNSAQFYWDETEENRRKYGHGKINAYRALTECGEIKENTTWDPSYVRDGCYYISGDLTIKPDVSLTINKGTVIKIAPDHEQLGDDPDRVQIIVQGSLRAGTGSGDIVFESFTDSPATKSDWVGIKIESSSQNSLIQGFVIRNAQVGIENHTEITISNCSIEDCEIGIETWGSIFVQNSDIQHCEDYGILARSGGVVVENSSISYSGLHGLGLNPYSSTDAIIASCNESALNHNYGYGVWAFAGGLPPGLSIDATMSKDTLQYNYAGAGLFDNGCLATIDSCIFGSNNYGIYVYDTSDPVIKRSTLAYDTTSGIRCSIGSNITIEQNNINHQYIGIDAYGSSNPSIKNGNTIQYNTYGIKCDDSDPVIEQNTIHENTIGIYAYRFSNPGIKNGNSIRYNTYGIECDLCSHPIVQENVIRYNAIGVLTVEGSCPILGTESGSPSRGHNSIFQNVVFHVSNQSGLLYEISADSNYWGPTGPKPSKFEGNVDYVPYLMSDPNPVSIALPGEDEPGNEKPDEVVPTQFSLSSSYPNPFNPITTIEYQVPEPGSLTTITIYNVKGQHVRTLLNDRKPPGYYSIVWDGRAESGEEVGSGIYFVMMKADGFKATKKLALLK